MNKFHFNEHKQDTWKCDWLIGHIRAYMSMKEKLLKYDMQVRRNPIFPIATVLDHRFKLEHIPHGEHNFFMKTLLNMLESVRSVEAFSCMSIDDLLASTTHKHSKLLMQIMQRQLNRSTTVDERSLTVKLEDYLCEPCIDYLRDDSLQWWHKRGSNKYPCLSVLAKEFLSICASSSPSERRFSTGRGIITFRRGRLAPNTISASMTLKSWSPEDATRDDEIDSEVE